MTEVLWEMIAGIPMRKIVGNEQATRTSGTEPKCIMFDPLIPEEYFEADPNPLDRHPMGVAHTQHYAG